jgi:hypothetical protein
MSALVITYRVRPDVADENQRLVEAVFAELAASDPGGIRYATWRLEDGTFVHVADVDGDSNPLAATAAFAAFQQDLAERCLPGQGPEAQPASLVGSYRIDL